MHVIAAKAVAFGEALRPAFKLYARNVEWRTPGRWRRRSSRRVSTSSPAVPTPISCWWTCGPSASPEKSRSWRSAAPTSPATRTASRSIPEKPAITSGIRLGDGRRHHPRLRHRQFQEVGDLIVEVLDVLLSQKGVEEDSLTEAAVREKVKRLVARFPIVCGTGDGGYRMAVKMSSPGQAPAKPAGKCGPQGWNPVADPALREFLAGSRVSLLRKAFSFASLARDTRARR